MFGKIIMAFKIAGAAYKWLCEVEAKGEERLNDENADRDRLRLEAFFFNLSQGNETGWRKYTEVDDALLRYFQRVMKSSKLNIVQNGSLLDAKQVEAALKAI